MNRTLIICKPDAVERNLVGEILRRFEAQGLRLEEFITRGPSLLGVLEGTDDTWSMVRSMMGATNPAEAAPGTIRGDLATLFTENLIHGSDSAESAEREIGIFFPDL